MPTRSLRIRVLVMDTQNALTQWQQKSFTAGWDRSRKPRGGLVHVDVCMVQRG